MSYDWSKFKVRCSAISKVLTYPQGKAPLTEVQRKRLSELSDKCKLTDNQRLEMAKLLLKEHEEEDIPLSPTCISYLMDSYAWNTYQKKSVSQELDIEYFTKGTKVEGESIELLAEVDGLSYEKNKEIVENDFLRGEPDIFIGPAILQAEKITDIKSVWDYPKFLAKLHKDDDQSNNAQQIRGYMDITGAPVGEIAYCLVSMPEETISEYLRKLVYKMNVVTDQDPAYVRQAAILELSMRFEDIPPHQRVFKVPIDPFTPSEQKQLYDRVKNCRDWLFKFDEFYQGLNI